MRRLTRSHDRLIRCGLGPKKRTCRVQVWKWAGVKPGKDDVPAPSDSWAAMCAAATAEIHALGL